MSRVATFVFLFQGVPLNIERVKDPNERLAQGSPILSENSCFVRGLPHSVSEERVKEVLADCGVVKAVRLLTHKDGNRNGCAVVDFERAFAASRAVQCSRKVNVS